MQSKVLVRFEHVCTPAPLLAGMRVDVTGPHPSWLCLGGRARKEQPRTASPQGRKVTNEHGSLTLSGEDESQKSDVTNHQLGKDVIVIIVVIYYYYSLVRFPLQS